MKIDGNDIRPGNVLDYKGKLWVVLKTQHVKPGKGGAYMQVEMKDVRGGTKTNVSFRAAEQVERARIDSKDCQYLYPEGDQYTFMDNETYEQFSVPSDMIGDPVDFLQDGMTVTVSFHEESPINVELPQHVVMEIRETEPVVKGQTAASSNKPAVLENGVRVMVPPFIDAGEKVVVDTAERAYVERAKA